MILVSTKSQKKWAESKYIQYWNIIWCWNTLHSPHHPPTKCCCHATHNRPLLVCLYGEFNIPKDGALVFPCYASIPGPCSFFLSSPFFSSSSPLHSKPLQWLPNLFFNHLLLLLLIVKITALQYTTNTNCNTAWGSYRSHWIQTLGDIHWI